jgi:hypothetical protein
MKKSRNLVTGVLTKILPKAPLFSCGANLIDIRDLHMMVDSFGLKYCSWLFTRGGEKWQEGRLAMKLVYGKIECVLGRTLKTK